jgi:FAD-dependent urate hydroxylase
MNYLSSLVSPSGGVVLLGDAAHNVTPQMGQGCNSALEDAAALAAALKAEGWQVHKGLQQYNKHRLPQVGTRVVGGG